MKTMVSQRDRVLGFLAKGPSHCAEIALGTGMPGASASRMAQKLVSEGLVTNVEPSARRALYALVPSAHRPVQRRAGAVHIKAEQDYVSQRKSGRKPRDLVSALGLTEAAARAFEQAYRLQGTSGYSTDNSCPKFAHHDRHLAALGLAKGFPAWSERRGPRGRPMLCPPLAWPLAAQTRVGA